MGIDLEEIRELMKLVEEADISSFYLEHNGTTIKIKKGVEQAVVANQATALPQLSVAPQALPQAPVESPSKEAAEAEASDAGLHQIVSPMVGTFYRAPSPEADPYVKEGDQVTEDSKVCIIEAMKLMNEIEAEVNGTIVKVLVENGQLVEYGQPLFLVKTT